jgi:hypothetical protein
LKHPEYCDVYSPYLTTGWQTLPHSFPFNMPLRPLVISGPPFDNHRTSIILYRAIQHFTVRLHFTALLALILVSARQRQTEFYCNLQGTSVNGGDSEQQVFSGQQFQSGPLQQHCI